MASSTSDDVYDIVLFHDETERPLAQAVIRNIKRFELKGGRNLKVHSWLELGTGKQDFESVDEIIDKTTFIIFFRTKAFLCDERSNIFSAYTALDDRINNKEKKRQYTFIPIDIDKRTRINSKSSFNAFKGVIVNKVGDFSDEGKKTLIEVLEEKILPIAPSSSTPCPDADLETKTTELQAFISYDRRQLDKARALQKHLEMAGYSCQMDLDYMKAGNRGGLDAEGIRQAKVMICLVCKQYGRNPDCERQIVLKNAQKDSNIIPLRVEQDGDCEGAVHLILASLFIQDFYTQQPTSENIYWQKSQFFELLLQISKMGAVIDKDVHPDYTDWMEREDITEQMQQLSTNDTSDRAPEGQLSFDVFISYQWDSQPFVIKLYEELKNQGFRCWMDKYEIKLGDSLWNKISQGVRASRVFLACVTTKYASSSACKNEVYFADKLKKLKIPLKLENCQWPPRGMEYVLPADLIYQDCCVCKYDWSEKDFQENVVKVIKDACSSPR